MSNMKHLIVVAALLLLLPAFAAGQESLERDVASMQVGENVTINATVVNPLPVSDSLTIIFNGAAINEGLVTPFYPEESGITCTQLRSRCTVQVDADSERHLRITLEGTTIGQETLTATVNSSTTQLSSTDRMQVRVKPFFGRVTVSAPGIQGVQIAVLAVLSALVAGYVFRREQSA